MPHLPARFAGLILAFAPLFVHRSWRHAQLLLIGAILTPGRRTVASLPRLMGRSHERRFVNFHRILTRAAWCPRAGSRILLRLLMDAFASHGPVVLALDETIERRFRQAHPGARHLPRSGALLRQPLRQGEWPALDEPDAARPDPPFAGRVWALPFLTALVPSE